MSVSSDVSASPRSLQSVDNSSAVEYPPKMLKLFFNNVTSGNKKKVKKCLKDGSVAVDSIEKNSGETALYKASVASLEQVVEILLQHGANPNHKTKNGSTPVHAAAKSGNVKIMQKLLEAGGDLRLHDHDGCSVFDWADSNENMKAKLVMMHCLDQTRNCAKELRKPFLTPRSRSGTLGTISTLLRRGRHHLNAVEPGPAYQMSPANSIYSMGFGKVYTGDRKQGALASVPIVPENDIKHDPHGVTYNNGPYMVMESMKWKRTFVTVKRLHQHPQPGGTVDLLISESQYMSKLRHPNLLLLMGICPTNNLDGMVLLYQRVGAGSLYHCLHEQVMSLTVVQQCKLMCQLCEALVYLHDQFLLHCCITSHAVQLFTLSDNHCGAKLGNLEYMIENRYPNNQTNVLENQQSFRSGAAHWMSPEVLAGEPPNTESDMYSLMAILWEVTHGGIPWAMDTTAEIQEEMVTNGTALKIAPPRNNIPDTLRVLLVYGLALNRESRRQISILQIREICRQLAEEMHDGPHNISSSTRNSRLTQDLELPQDIDISMDESPTMVEDSSYTAVYKRMRSESPREGTTPKMPFILSTTLENENEYTDMTGISRYDEEGPSRPPRRVRSPTQENVEPSIYVKDQEPIKMEPASFFDARQKKKIIRKTFITEAKTSDTTEDMRNPFIPETRTDDAEDDMNLTTIVNQIEKKILVEPTASKPPSANRRYSQSRIVNSRRRKLSRGKDSPDGAPIHSPGQRSLGSPRSKSESFTAVLTQPLHAQQPLSPERDADDEDDVCDPIGDARAPCGRKSAGNKSLSYYSQRFSSGSACSFGEFRGPFKPASHRTSVDSTSSAMFSFSGPDVLSARNNHVTAVKQQFENGSSEQSMDIPDARSNKSGDSGITRSSKVSQQEESMESSRGVRDLIQNFQSQAEKHEKEQAVLQVKKQKLYTRSISLPAKSAVSEKQLSHTLAREAHAFMSTRTLSSDTVRPPPITAMHVTLQETNPAEGLVHQKESHVSKKTAYNYDKEDQNDNMIKEDSNMRGANAKETWQKLTVTRSTETTDSLLNFANEKRSEAEEEDVFQDANQQFSFRAHPPKGVPDKDVDQAVDFLIQQINDGLGDVGLRSFDDHDDTASNPEEWHEVPIQKTESNTYKTEVRFDVQEPLYIPVEYEKQEIPSEHAELMVEAADNQNNNSVFTSNQEVHMEQENVERETVVEQLAEYMEYGDDGQERRDMAKLHKDVDIGEYVEGKTLVEESAEYMEYANDVQKRRVIADSVHKDIDTEEYVAPGEYVNTREFYTISGTGQESVNTTEDYPRDKDFTPIEDIITKDEAEVVEHFTTEIITPTETQIHIEDDQNVEKITEFSYATVNKMMRRRKINKGNLTGDSSSESESRAGEDGRLIDKHFVKKGLTKLTGYDEVDYEDQKEYQGREDAQALNEPEEFYFDDEISPEMLKDRNMRLQTTLGLGQTTIDQQHDSITVESGTPLAHSTRCFGDSDTEPHLQNISSEEDKGREEFHSSNKARVTFARSAKVRYKGRSFQTTREGTDTAEEDSGDGKWSDETYTLDESDATESGELLREDGDEGCYEQGSSTEGSIYSPYDDKEAVKQVLARRQMIRERAEGRQQQPSKPPRSTRREQSTGDQQQHLDVIAEEGYRTTVQIRSTLDDDDDQEPVHRVTTRIVNLATGDAQQKETTIVAPRVKSTVSILD